MKQALAGVVTLSPRPNYLESWPVKTFEYMHASLPVVASNFPFWKKLLTPHQCAVFVDPTNPERIAEGLCWILENPKTARAMGAQGRCAALRYYLWKDQSKVLLREYHKIEQKIKTMINKSLNDNHLRVNFSSNPAEGDYEEEEYYDE